MAWAKSTSKTLTGTTGSVATDTFTGKIFNQIMLHSFESAAIDYNEIQYSGNTNSVYTDRYNTNGGTDNTQTSTNANVIDSATNPSDELFAMLYAVAVSGEEKLTIGFSVRRVTAGSGTAPTRVEMVAKFVPSPDSDITEVKLLPNNGTGSYLTDSNLSAIGTD